MAARILVADDSVTIQKVVELTFSKENFVLVQARSGEEAIRKAKEERPDLVLLDLVMPDKNGYEVCAALRAEAALQTVPILLLTGTFEPFDKEKGLQAGATDFVTKPFESQVLVGKVKQLLFAKTVDMAPPAATTGPSTAVPPSPGSPPPPTPRSAAPGVVRGVVPPSPAPTPPPRRGVAPAQPRGPASVPAPAPMAAATPWEKPMPAEPVPAEPAPPPPVAPPMAGRTLDLSPPTEEISQDRARSVMEPAPGLAKPPAVAGLGELSFEEPATLPLPERPDRPGSPPSEVERAVSGPEPVSKERSSPGPEPVQKKEAAPPPGVRAAALPESLSLEELLSAESTAAPPASESAPIRLEELPGGPVFDLTSEMGGPSLPLVEVGTGEPPTLSIDDLLAAAEAAPPPPAEVGALEPSAPGPKTPPEAPAGEPVFDLAGAQEAPPPLPLEVEAEESSALSIKDLRPLQESTPGGADMMGLREIEFEPISSPPGEEAPAATTATPPLDLGALIEVPFTEEERLDFEAALTGGKAPAPPSVVPPAVVPPEVVAPPEMAAGPPSAATIPTEEALPPVAAAAPPGGAEPLMPGMAGMRQAVTERVAHELARDLSEKLLERIERIVWEVVPDLAEILITKEIERIRSQAEGKQSS